MRRAAAEAKKPDASKQLELSPMTLYLLLYNGAQAFGSEAFLLHGAGVELHLTAP